MSSIFTWHPTLQSFTTDTNECKAKPGTTWTILAIGGSCGSAMLAVWLDCTVAPLGSLIVNGVVVICLSCTGADDSKKWLDAPESNIAQAILFFSVKDIFGGSADAAIPYRPWLFFVLVQIVVRYRPLPLINFD